MNARRNVPNPSPVRSWTRTALLSAAAGVAALAVVAICSGDCLFGVCAVDRTAEFAPRAPIATSTDRSQPITLADATRRSHEDGTFEQFITTRSKPGGRKTTPKYADKAWDWFVSRRVEPGETALPAHYREKAVETALAANNDRSALAERSRVAAWTGIQPTAGVQPSGRIVELAVDPTNDQVIYAASASGGVWKTTNRGASWANVTDGFIPSQGVGAIEIDPFTPSTVYIGLGEGVPGSFFEPFGAGVYRSTDAGATWSLLSSTSGFNYVTDIKVISSSSVIMVAAKGLRDGTGGGMFRSTNSGQTWSTPPGTFAGYTYYDISVDQTNRNNVLVTEGRTAGHPTFPDFPYIYYSSDAGSSFTTTFPFVGVTNVGAARIELAQNGGRVYALFGGEDGSVFGMLGSDSGGQDWVILPLNGIPTSGDYKPGQMYYNCSIAVAPDDIGAVYMGSNLRMYKSFNSGSNWLALTDWAGDAGLPYAHADHHSIRFGATGNTVYLGCDGGFFYSLNGGVTWTEANTGLEAGQCYRMDNNRTNANALIAGMQDNDKYLRRADGTWHHYPNTWGDGMEMIAHDPNPATFMGSNYYGSAVQITENAGGNWFLMRTYGAGNNGIPDNEQGSWVTPFIADPQNPNMLYLGLHNIYRATYSPGLLPTWTPIITINPQFTASNMEHLILTAGPTGRKLVGFLGRSDQGSGGALSFAILRANPDGTGQEFLNPPQTSSWVNALAADPNSNDTIWLGYSNIASTPGPRPRIFKSTTLGDSWQDMTNDFPQDLPVSAIFVDPANSNTVIVGSDIGAFRSDNGGASWTYWNDGLPNVVISDFAFYPPTRTLRAATYGRGVWETPLATESAASASEIRDFLLGLAGLPAGADRNGNGRVEVGDVVRAVNQP